MKLLKQGIEVPLLLVFCAISLSGPLSTNLVIYRTCYVLLGYNETACAQLGINSHDNATMDLERIVEPLSNYIHMSIALLTSIVPALVCLFIGPWSDVLGRRTVMIANLSGLMIMFALKVFISIFPISPWFLLLEAVPTTLTGGVPTFIIVTLCYLTDTTTASNRGVRMGIFEAFIGLGMLFGTLSSSYIFKALDYYGSFSICFMFVLFAFLYSIFVLEESVVQSDNECQELCSLVHVKAMFSATFKPRDGYNRFILLITIVAVSLFQMGEMNGTVMNFLLRSQFGWSLTQYTIYSSMQSVIWITGTFFGVFVLHKLFRLSECPLILVGLAALVMSSALILMAKASWYIYTALALRFLGGSISPMTRSLLSKIIPPDEISKVFSLAIAVESLTVISSAPIYTLVYNNTLNTFPAAFQFVTFSCYLWNFITFMIISLLKIRPNNLVYVVFENDDIN